MEVKCDNRQTLSYLWLLTGGHFLSDFYANFLPALLPVVISNLGISLTVSGLLVMVFAITSSMLQPVFGYFVDKSGYTWLILTTLPISAVFICFGALSSTPVMLFSSVALAGLATSLFHPLGSSLIGRTTNHSNKSISMSIFVGGGNLGYALAPVIVIYLIASYGIEYLPWLVLPSIVITTAYYITGLHKVNLTINRESFTNDERWYKSKSIIKLNLVMALRSWPQVAIPTFLPVMLSLQGYEPTLAGNMLTIFLLSGAIGGLIGGYCGDKFGYKNCIIGALIFGLIPTYMFLSTEGLHWIIWISLGLCGAALQSMVPSSIIWAQHIMPKNAAMASGMMLGLSFGLGGVGTAVTGILADLIGLKLALLATLVPLIISIPIAFSIPVNEHHLVNTKSC
ncbi:MFS transporter [Dendrosporobacter sp. 1207_IL3150]|uniref:MFS transporter n=1 Tax=Dendrosporobacter sp. 1207_IL3150 TaxID=3084054 RepID=UPI002FDA8484